MLLAFDIGNTSVGCGLFDGDEMVARWEFDADLERSWRAYAEDLQRALADAGISEKEIGMSELLFSENGLQYLLWSVVADDGFEWHG